MTAAALLVVALAGSPPDLAPLWVPGPGRSPVLWVPAEAVPVASPASYRAPAPVVRIGLIGAEWCGPCREEAKAAHGLAGVFHLDYDRDAAKVRRLWDVPDVRDDLKTPEGLPAKLPACVVFVDGVPRRSFIGPFGREWFLRTLAGGPSYAASLDAEREAAKRRAAEKLARRCNCPPDCPDCFGDCSPECCCPARD